MPSSDFLARIKLQLEGRDQVVSGLQQVQGAAQKLTKTTVTSIFDKQGALVGKQVAESFKVIGDESSKAAPKMGDFEKAMRRVLIVAPVWMIFRTIMSAFFEGLKAGIKSWEDIDRSIEKAKGVVHLAGMDMETAMTNLESRARSLSQTTGESISKIIDVFSRFSKAGLEFNSAWEATQSVIKFAETTFTDVNDVSKTLAMVFKMLGNTIDSSIPSTERYNTELAKMWKLTETNIFDANELVDSFKSFLPTAKAYGLTLDQTTALLATLDSANMNTTRSGQLLRTSFSKLLEDLPKLAATLGLYVNPQAESTFQIFMKVLGAIKQLGGGAVTPAAQEAITKIFGGVRTGEAVKTLVTMYDELNKNLSITEGKYNDLSPLLKEYAARTKDIEESGSHQIVVFKQLSTQVFETFVKGITGAKDFAGAMQEINTQMKSLESIVGGVSRGFHNLWEATSKASPLFALINMAGVVEGAREAKKHLAELKEFADRNLSGRQMAGQAIASLGTSLVAPTAMSILPAIAEQMIEKYKTQGTENANLLRQLENKKILEKDGLKIIEMQHTGYSQSAIALEKISQQINKTVTLYNSLDLVVSGTKEKLNAHAVLTDIINNNWEKVIDKLKIAGLKDTDILKLEDEVGKLSADRAATTDKLIDAELEELKLRGATSKILLEAEMSLKAMAYGEDTVKNSLEYQLKLRKEQTKEMLLQFDLGNDTKALYKVATEVSVQAAKSIGDVLAGKNSIENLRKFEPNTYETFQKYFPQKAESIQMLEYFGIAPWQKGIGGGRFFGAAGGQITIPEAGDLKSLKTMSEIAKAQNNLSGVNLHLPEINGLTINLSSVLEGTNKEEKVKFLIDKIADAIRNNPDVKTALFEKIDEF